MTPIEAANGRKRNGSLTRGICHGNDIITTRPYGFAGCFDQHGSADRHSCADRHDGSTAASVLARYFLRREYISVASHPYGRDQHIPASRLLKLSFASANRHGFAAGAERRLHAHCVEPRPRRHGRRRPSYRGVWRVRNLRQFRGRYFCLYHSHYY